MSLPSPSFVKCLRCESDVCLKKYWSKDIYQLVCFSCGFYTFSNLYRNSKLAQANLEKAPKLYVDLVYYDNEGRIWMPTTITIPDKGMVFAEGTSIDNWYWKSCKWVPLTKTDIESKKFPKNQKTKIDFENGKVFDNNKFMSALHNINYFNIT